MAATPETRTVVVLPFLTPPRPLLPTQALREVPVIVETPCSYMADRFLTFLEPHAPQLTIATPHACSQNIAMTAKWLPGKMLVGLAGKPVKRSGLIYRGLGLWQLVSADPVFFKRTISALYHLGTGHKICMLLGEQDEVLPPATMIAELMDWTFDGLEGWRNILPDLPRRLAEIERKFPDIVQRGEGTQNEALARAVFMARQ